MVFRPVRDFIVVEPLVSETVSAGGVVLPDSVKKGNLRGTVVRVGDGRWNAQLGKFHGLSVGVGDVVLFNEFAGLKLTIEGKEFVVIKDADVIGVFEGA